MQRTLEQRIGYERTEHGVDLYILPTSARDIVIAQMALPGGAHAVYDKQAVALLVSEMMPSGARGKKRAAVREAFESLGAQVSITEGDEHLMVSLACRTTVFNEAFALLVQVLTHPQVTPREFAEAVSSVSTTLESAMEDTRTRAGVAALRSLYAPGHPHWEPLPRELRTQLAHITLAEVHEFYRGTLSSVGAVVVLAGDIRVRDTLPCVRETLAALPSKRPQRTPVVHPDHTNTVSEMDQIIPLKDKMNVDTVLYMPLSLTRDHADFHALAAGVHVLGGSFTARLFTSLRVRQSLTYSAYASLSGLADGYAGYLQAHAIFPNDVFARGRSALRTEVEQWAVRGITATELTRRKEELAGKYKVGLSTTKGLCATLFDTVMAGRSLAYLDEYPSIIESLTLREVNAAIKEHVRYDLAVTAAAGAIGEDGKPLV